MRPRAGEFVYSLDIFEIMKLEVQFFKSLGAKEIVVGITSSDGKLHRESMEQLRDLAYPMNISIHRAFDSCMDPLAELDQLIQLGGFNSILTSGKQPTAWEGRDLLRDMVKYAKDNISIIPAGRITQANLQAIHQAVGAQVYHGRKILGSLV